MKKDYKAGYIQGHVTGWKKGYKEGLQAGHTMGVNEMSMKTYEALEEFEKREKLIHDSIR